MLPPPPTFANNPLFPVIEPRIGWSAYPLAVVFVALALASRMALGAESHVFYLPPIIAVIASAALAGRRPTFLAIALTVIANLTVAEGPGDGFKIGLALLFGVIAWLIAEVQWELRAIRVRANELSVHLDRRQTMLDTILTSVPVVTLNSTGDILMLTDPACALFNTSQDAVGRPFKSFVEAFDISDVAAQTVERSPEDFWTGRRENGAKFPLNIQTGLIPRQPCGEHVILCLTDLSQSHAADAHARDLHTQLNRVWRLNSLGEMAASLAHELNQPLSAATTYLHASQMDVARVGLMGESAARTIELAKTQLLRAGQIIRRMRELLAHESRSLGVERVGAMVADLSGVFAMIERAGGVQIDIHIDDVNDRVQADRIQFQQAMLNLVRNAVEALSGLANPRVQIFGRLFSETEFELRVEDNGRGIPPDQMDTIFRPLMTTKSGGMGLGLSVTRTIVESHGGVLKVETSDLGGAAFSFCLMREQELEPA